MSEFWDDLFNDIDTDEEENEGFDIRDALKGLLDDVPEDLRSLLSDIPESLVNILKRMASATPQFIEAKEYLHDGLHYIISNYMDEDEIVTHKGTSHCAIVDAVMIDTSDDEEVDALFEAIRGNDELKIMTAIKDLLHHSIHVGMATGIGMLIDEGKVGD